MRGAIVVVGNSAAGGAPVTEPHIDTWIQSPWSPDLVMEADSASVLPLTAVNDNEPVQLPCDVEQH